ncbi:VOC family protein [Luteolibacter sp. GHJ8]|uniref:VOC family protein n=1 Tax=Luteolibacter rhizosphaerae TaxID=2989719 RepID=A0ABT3G137_9BACT|nr:VOC family protein [Luteolibacter rhizosphaerae]MCW1913552.1 VOC family protein [Luteolibacter rhizosphaerae]
MSARLNLTVIRCADIEASAAFYRLLGLAFEKHRHGKGPEHFASTGEGPTFELYPASERFPVTMGTRLGFAVASCDEACRLLEEAGHVIETPAADSPWGRRAVAIDPGGHRVEIVS